MTCECGSVPTGYPDVRETTHLQSRKRVKLTQDLPFQIRAPNPGDTPLEAFKIPDWPGDEHKLSPLTNKELQLVLKHETTWECCWQSRNWRLLDNCQSPQLKCEQCSINVR